MGEEVAVRELDTDDCNILKPLVEEFCSYYDMDAAKIMDGKFNKLIPVSSRPYGNLYAY
jgi:hypothetical protein